MKNKGHEICLENVQILYPNIINRAVFNNKEENYQATFLLDKKEHTTIITKILESIDSLCKEVGVDKVDLNSNAFQDGDFMKKEDYHGYFVIKSSSNFKPVVLDKDAVTPITEEDDITTGSIVRAYVNFKLYKNTWGTGIKAYLIGVQLLKSSQFKRSFPAFVPFTDEEIENTFG